MNIKGPKGPGGPAAIPDSIKPKTPKAEGASFKEALDAKSAPQTNHIQSGVEQVVETLCAQVRAGNLSSEEARGRLVSEIAKAMGPMPDEMRSRLESFLQAQLQSDPSLSRHAAVLFDNEG